MEHCMKIKFRNGQQLHRVTDSPKSICHTLPIYFVTPPFCFTGFEVLYYNLRLLHFRLGGARTGCNNRLEIVRLSFPILCCYEIFEYNCLLKMNDCWCCFMELQENKIQYTNSSRVTDSPSLCHTPSNLFCPNPSVIQGVKYVLQFRLWHNRK